MANVATHPSARHADREYNLTEVGNIGDVAVPLSAFERLTQNGAVRRTLVLVLLAILWEVSARWTDNPLMFPSLTDTLSAFREDMASGVIPARAMTSLEVLIMGYTLAITLAMIFTVIAVTSSFGSVVLSTMVSMFNPLPALAILPLALLWLGVGTSAIILVMVQAVVWTVSMNTFAGFQSVPETLRMAGQNFGLSRINYIFRILIPAAFPYILTGLKIGWAHAWRTLIGAELVFGVASRSGGIGWYIFENRAQLETAHTFAGLLTVIIIGFLMENLVFRVIERRTVLKWGMMR